MCHMGTNKEIWKDIPGYKGFYKVSNLGRVKSFLKSHERILKPTLINTGYLSLVLMKNKSRKTFNIHRLIALAFIPNPENKRTVNHKNGIKSDNRIDNLEWATYSENTKHAYDIGLIKHLSSKDNPLSIPVYQYTKEGKFLRKYDSENQAAKISGLTQSHINMNTLGKCKTAKGYIWKREKTC